MDYGSSIHDAENPAGASPWGNSPESSPRHTRTTFNQAAGGEPPASPFRLPSQTTGSNGLAGEPDNGGFGGGETDYRPNTASSTVSAAESSQLEEPEPRQVPQQQPSQQQLPQGFPAKPSSADQAHAQQGQEQQPRRPPQPQFKLQAKITGLERTGRKDPILRFDVHVRKEMTRTLR